MLFQLAVSTDEIGLPAAAIKNRLPDAHSKLNALKNNRNIYHPQPAPLERRLVLEGSFRMFPLAPMQNYPAVPDAGATISDNASDVVRKPHLLIVDDIGDNRAVLTRRFERRDFIITEAENGEDALSLIRQNTFDVVLLDIVMPGIDGIETLQRIRADKSASELPVIMVTAKTESDDVVQALALGANDYVTKPVNFAVAMARVNVQIDRRRAELELAERTKRLVEANQKLTAEIYERQQSEARSQYLAYHDYLTGLGNRFLFKEQLEDVLKGELDPQPLAVLLIDLDGFKAVNDAVGHSIGDDLLKVVASGLRNILGSNDRIARLGGDEFAILQTCVAQPTSACLLAEQIITLLAAPCGIDIHDVTIGASIGIAVSRGAETSSEQLLKSADLAIYRAKSDGGGTYRLFNPEMDAIAKARRTLERDMRNGLHNEFRLFYQPLVNLETKRVKAFEALMRWEHPERGLVSPAEFIPIAEETGLIVPLGEWALRQACTDAMNWHEDISVSVNLSPIQFLKGNLTSIVMNALATTGLPASRLELEITESILLEKSDRNLDILRQLRQIGVRISMDDFGTGYSSIGYLHSFRFDKIKIDQSFIKDLIGDEGSLAIVRAITGLSKTLGIVTTAEGVESREQLIQLQLEGCDEVQGYFFSKPIPADKLSQLLVSLADQSLLT